MTTSRPRPRPRPRPRTLTTLALLAPLVLGGFLGCTERKTSDRDLMLVDPPEAADLAQGQRGLLAIGEKKRGVFVDVRIRADYEVEHIPGAIHLELADLDRAVRLLEPYDPVIVYGAGYDGTVANATSKSLIEKGIKNVYTLRGGLRGWKTEGNAVEP